ncbi:hypothetical protein J2S40_003029 [Nocardioides luteus]|uniref:Uncharacterized protein n=1 Tax=Nocardioides luteus TaxID=1844 RepID=A0ABQ5SVJ5_9ACTN|nr:hypothetical protein [Nocardioides luteus]GLJ68215.1 hypothetical protein GCM10017579_22510 [Nocardioides luteus]
MGTVHAGWRVRATLLFYLSDQSVGPSCREGAPVDRGRQTGVLGEALSEVGGGAETGPVRDLVDGQVRSLEEPAGVLDPHRGGCRRLAASKPERRRANPAISVDIALECVGLVLLIC